MSDQDAFEDEMVFRALSDRDAERLLRGLAPENDALAELAEFSQAVRAQLARPPEAHPELVARLATTAHSAARAGATSPVAGAAELRRRAPRRRLPLVARAAGLVAAVPLLFAGLAAADVTVPQPARDAFEAVGIELPNQPAEDDSPAEQREPGGEQSGERSGAKPADGADSDADVPGKKDAGERGQGTAKDNPARSGGRDEGAQGQGRALGKRGLAPGQTQPPGQTRAPGQVKQPPGRTQPKPQPSPPKQSAKPAQPAAPPVSPGPPQGKGQGF